VVGFQAIHCPLRLGVSTTAAVLCHNAATTPSNWPSAVTASKEVLSCPSKRPALPHTVSLHAGLRISPGFRLIMVVALLATLMLPATVFAQDVDSGSTVVPQQEQEPWDGEWESDCGAALCGEEEARARSPRWGAGSLRCTTSVSGWCGGV
jgi:hypothetical protein